jgi:pyruvate formate lyase activating enzyme
MKFGGWHQCSLIDFPGKICAVLFTEGCSFRCPFCHNPGLVLPDRFIKNPISENEIFSFLEKRKGKLDGVTITGGEPTIQTDLKDFIKKVKFLGFAVKLDTNGSCPNVVESLLREGLLDYIAMDIKASLPRYHELCGVTVDTSLIEKTIHLIINSAKDYEFRTTLIKELHNEKEILAMAKSISGAKRYTLQKFRADVTLDESLQSFSSYSNEEMVELCKAAMPYVQECNWR